MQIRHDENGNPEYDEETGPEPYESLPPDNPDPQPQARSPVQNRLARLTQSPRWQRAKENERAILALLVLYTR